MSKNKDDFDELILPLIDKYKSGKIDNNALIDQMQSAIINIAAQDEGLKNRITSNTKDKKHIDTRVKIFRKLEKTIPSQATTAGLLQDVLVPLIDIVNDATTQYTQNSIDHERLKALSTRAAREIAKTLMPNPKQESLENITKTTKQFTTGIEYLKITQGMPDENPSPKELLRRQKADREFTKDILPIIDKYLRSNGEEEDQKEFIKETEKVLLPYAKHDANETRTKTADIKMPEAELITGEKSRVLFAMSLFEKLGLEKLTHPIIEKLAPTSFKAIEKSRAELAEKVKAIATSVKINTNTKATANIQEAAAGRYATSVKNKPQRSRN